VTTQIRDFEKSTDNGNSWLSGLNDCGYIVQSYDIESDNSFTNLYSTSNKVSGERNIFKSTDSGNNWLQIYPESDGEQTQEFRGIAIEPHNNNIVYVTGNWGKDVFKTTDGGQNWAINFHHLVSGQSGYYSILIDKNIVSDGECKNVYIGGDYSSDNLERSTDAGSSWATYNSGVSNAGTVWSLSQSITDNVGNYYIYAGTSSGLYRKPNTSDTWTQINRGIVYTNIATVAADPSQTNVVYAGGNDNNSYGHIYQSTDNGSHWSEISTGFPSARINQLKFSSVSLGTPKLYAATSAGLYEMSSGSNDKQKQNKYFSIAYPNPFNPSTKISFNLKVSSLVNIKIYDILGQEVKTLINGQLDKGVHVIDFNASDFASGVYFYKLTINNDFNEFRKILLVK